MSQNSAPALPVEGQLAGLRYKHLCNFEKTAPLVVLVHGRAGNFDVMWAFKRAMPEGVNFVAPQAPLPDAGGFSWWEIGKPKEEMRESAQRAAETLAVFVNQYIAQSNLAPSRLLLVGFSQGGALISLAIQQETLLVHGAALLASFAIKLPDSKINCPVFIAHGSNDEVIPLSQSESSRDYLLSCGAKVDFVVDDVGHKVGVNGMKELKAWSDRIVRS